ncbi:hypothetical protein [Streptomyces sp. MNP-20]|uniref:hypothetical protein n=1 Tax=Streptomyces sp. MNP-20 TaxID=2721165 RepID=UPI0015561A71|nr:hypothetical protein [Streptomyces sp. MNP-20]
MFPTPLPTDAVHRDRLHQLALFLHESEQILTDFDTWREEHSDIDGWPLDDVEHSRRAVKRDADTWRSFTPVRSFAKELLATAEVQVQQLNPGHIQSRWPWQLGILDHALKRLGLLQREWLAGRDALPPTEGPGSFAYDDTLAERNEEAWTYLEDWSSHGQALIDIQAAAHAAPPCSPSLTAAKTAAHPAVAPATPSSSAVRR